MKKNCKTIIVFCPNWVGDVVMATPVFACLRHNFAGARLVGVIRKYAQGVVEDGSWFDHVIVCDDKTVRGLFALVRKIRSLHPEIAIVLPNSLRPALVAWLAGVEYIYGYRRNYRSLLLSGGPKPLAGEDGVLPIPMVDYYLNICHWLGLEVPDQTKPTLHYSVSIAEKGQRVLEDYGVCPEDMLIGLNPGAKFGSSKCWPPEYFAKLAELFAARWDCKILLFVGPGEDGIARSISENSQAEIINPGSDKVDLSLLKYLVKRCQLLVTNDTGPRHYAVALGVPVVVIMGPTDPRYTAANLEKTLVLRQELDCSPCHLKECPLNHECMVMIKPETVFEESQKLLEMAK